MKIFGQDTQDHLKNRRALALIAFFFVLFWPILLLFIHLNYDLKIDAVVVFLGYAGTFGSSPIVAYFMAANKDDKSK